MKGRSRVSTPLSVGSVVALRGVRRAGLVLAVKGRRRVCVFAGSSRPTVHRADALVRLDNRLPGVAADAENPMLADVELVARLMREG